MPYKYIGRTTTFKGKSLWEIVGNLKNFGIGRIVTRSRFERYPEPTYMKILKVEPLPCPENVTMDDSRKVRVLVEKTFRGQLAAKPILIESASYKTDYRLIPKDEEAEFCGKNVAQTSKIYPKFMDFPPLLNELLIRENKANGEESGEKPKLEVVYRKKNAGVKIAEENETPTISFDGGIEGTKYKELYANIKL